MHPKNDSDCSDRMLVERAIVRHLVDEILGKGYRIAVTNGDDEYPPTSDRDTLLDDLYVADEERIYIVDSSNNTNLGWIYLVYGNDGYDVIANHTVDISPIINTTNNLCMALDDTNPTATLDDLRRRGIAA